jgi:hypothetical protein
MDLQEYIKSCPSFAPGNCSHQLLPERAYLIPQLMKPEELEMCERLILECEPWLHSPAGCRTCEIWFATA